MTHSEIATHTGRPLGTVKTQMRRGLKKVRELLDADGGAADE
jgi:DNA-directed RNA polymerase specialized sigma24 family protein